MRLRNASTGESIRNFIGDPIRITSAAFGPDGKRFVTGAADGSVRVWDVESGQELLTLLKGGEAVRAVAWPREGDSIFALADALHRWETVP